MIPASLTCALIVALLVQTIGSVFAGAWLLFFLTGCALMVYKDGGMKLESDVQKACLAWLAMLGLSAFVLAPIVGAAAFMWILMAMPILALSMRPEYLRNCLVSFYAVLLVYAIGIILQCVLQVSYTNPDYTAHVWPVLDANNAAALLNFGLIPSFALAIRKDKWWFPTTLFVLAMLITGSRAGFCAAAVSCFILAVSQWGRRSAFAILFMVGFLWLDAAGFAPELIERAMNPESMYIRLDLWSKCLTLANSASFTGFGLGSFQYYYAVIRSPTGIQTSFAHNDLLQFIIELGWIPTSAFILLVCTVAFRTTKQNLAAACVMLAILLQSMLEFQFYVPAISILMGLALAYHIHKGPSHEILPNH